MKDEVKLYLYAIKNNLNPELIKIDPLEVKKLYATGVIKRNSSGLYVAEEEAEIDSVEDWIGEYRELFKMAPKGDIGNKAQCIERMIWFLRETKYSKEEALEATSNYITDCIRSNRYAMLPHHFIHKSPVGRAKKDLTNSALYEWCDRLSHREEDAFSKMV